MKTPVADALENASDRLTASTSDLVTCGQLISVLDGIAKELREGKPKGFPVADVQALLAEIEDRWQEHESTRPRGMYDLKRLCEVIDECWDMLRNAYRLLGGSEELK